MKRFILLFLFLFFQASFGQIEPVPTVQELARASAEFQKIEQSRQAQRLQMLKQVRFTRSGQDNFDQYFYDLHFSITLTPEMLEGDVTGYFRSNVNGLQQIQLDFDSREDIQAWQNLSVSGNVSDWTLANWTLTITLDRPYNFGETFSVTVHYKGLPRTGGFKGFSFDTNSFGSPVISTLSEPYLARTWWPSKDNPADKLDSVRISVTVPNSLIVASNGLLTEVVQTAPDSLTYVWFEKYPITTYLVSLAISNYATFQDSFEYEPGKFMPIEYYVYPPEVAVAEKAFEKLPEMLRVYSDLFGMYPFIEEKYGHAHFEWGGAMEHQTCTSIGYVSTYWETVYAHELSHQWFGDLVTCRDWGNIWMNEGFATYSEALWLEKSRGEAAYHDYINSYEDRIDSWGSDAIYRYNTDDVWYIFHRTVYTKGMWVLHMLRHVLGDSVFLAILHDYPNDPRFAFKDVTTEDFQDFCEEKTGRQLGWFFQQWIYEPGYPVYKWGYGTYSQGGERYLYLQIKQTQGENLWDHLYKMPIDIRIEFPNAPAQTVVIWDSLETQEFHLPIPEDPVALVFDPDNWLLEKNSQIEVSIPAPEPPSTFVLEQNYPNPFNGSTTIRFGLKDRGQISLQIYDLSGRKVQTLLEGTLEPGWYEPSWDGTDWRGQPVASGLYIYRLKTPVGNLQRKLLLIR